MATKKRARIAGNLAAGAGSLSKAVQGGQLDHASPVVNKTLLTNEIHKVPLSDIDLDNDTFQFRLDLKDQQLRQSIEREGQQFPIVLRKVNPPHQLVCGFRRVGALKALGRSSVKAIIVPRLSDDQAYRLSILENRERTSLSDLDVANVAAKLRARGKNPKEVARFFDRSVRQIQRYLEVSNFPPELKRAISSGKITVSHGLVLNRALVDGSRIDVKHWLGKIQEKKLSVPALKRHLAEALGRHRKVQYFRKRRKGFRIAAFEFDPTKTTPRERREMVTALTRALQALKKAVRVRKSTRRSR